MHPKYIIAALHEAGKSPTDAAKDLNVRPSNVSNVIYDRSRSRRIAVFISGTTGIPLAKLWPGVYDDNFDHKVRAA